MSAISRKVSALNRARRKRRAIPFDDRLAAVHWTPALLRQLYAAGVNSGRNYWDGYYGQNETVVEMCFEDDVDDLLERLQPPAPPATKED